jgi:hypothetical protein
MRTFILAALPFSMVSTSKHFICQHCVHSLPAEVRSVVAVFREDDVTGGIGEVRVAKVVFVTPGDLTAKSFRLQPCTVEKSLFSRSHVSVRNLPLRKSNFLQQFYGVIDD